MVWTQQSRRGVSFAAGRSPIGGAFQIRTQSKDNVFRRYLLVFPDVLQHEGSLEKPRNINAAG